MKAFAKINKKQVTDGFLVMLAFFYVPQLFKMIMPNTQLTGIAGTAANTGLIYVLGGLLKNPTLSNFALGMGLAQLLQSFISPSTPVLPKVETKSGGALMLQQEANTNIDRYRFLSTYVDTPSLTMKARYAGTYN